MATVLKLIYAVNLYTAFGVL